MVEYSEYPDYKDSGIDWLGEIPIEWNVFKLRRSVNTINGGVWGEEPNIQEETIRCVRVADFDRHDSSIHARNPTTRSYLQNEVIKKAAHYGDLIIEKSGGGEKTPVGNVVLYTGSTPIMYSNFVAKVSLAKNQNPAFWCYMHKTLYGYGVNIRSIKQNTGIQNLDIDSYFDEKVCFPPLETQNQIVAFLDAETKKIDDSVSSMESLISLLTEKRSALISETAIRGVPGEHTEFKDSGVEWLGEIPVGWEIKKVGNLFENRSEKVSDKEYPALSVTKKGIVPQLSNAAKTDDGDNRKKILKGDFVINSRSDRKGSSGVSPLDGSTSLISTVLMPNGELVSGYIHNLLRSVEFQEEYYRYGRGIVADLWTTRFSDMKGISLPVPSIQEQEKIVQYLSEALKDIDTILETANSAKGLLKEKRQVLISDTVTGKIDVRNSI